MKRRVSAPLHIESENKYRSWTGGFAAARNSAKTREDVALILTQIPKPPSLVDGEPNRYVVTLTRISAGYLDDDNLRGAFKAVRDEVARWIGIDDGHVRIQFAYGQEGCRRGRFGIRIEVSDDLPGEDYARELAGVPNVTREATARGEKAVPMPAARVAQVELVFRRSFAVLPWEQDGGEPVLSELSMKGCDPPKIVRMRVPMVALSGAASIRVRPGGEITLERGLARVEGESIWVYSMCERPTQATTAERRPA